MAIAEPAPPVLAGHISGDAKDNGNGVGDDGNNCVRVVSYNVLFSVACDATHAFNVRKFKCCASTGDILNMDLEALPHHVYTSREEADA